MFNHNRRTRSWELHLLAAASILAINAAIAASQAAPAYRTGTDIAKPSPHLLEIKGGGGGGGGSGG